MRVHGLPIRHEDPEIDLLRGYVESAVEALASRGIEIDQCWLDPYAPRDATIVFRSEALVWNEWTGWRSGLFEGGRQGQRTVLSNAADLGGAILMDPHELTERLVSGTTGEPLQARGPATGRDGLDDALYSWILRNA